MEKTKKGGEVCLPVPSKYEIQTTIVAEQNVSKVAWQWSLSAHIELHSPKLHKGVPSNGKHYEIYEFSLVQLQFSESKNSFYINITLHFWIHYAANFTSCIFTPTALASCLRISAVHVLMSCYKKTSIFFLTSSLV